MLDSSVGDYGFESRSDQHKDYNIGSCCYLRNVNSLDSTTFTPTTLTIDEIDNHMYASCTFGILNKGEELDLPAIPTGLRNYTSVL